MVKGTCTAPAAKVHCHLSQVWPHNSAAGSAAPSGLGQALASAGEAPRTHSRPQATICRPGQSETTICERPGHQIPILANDPGANQEDCMKAAPPGPLAVGAPLRRLYYKGEAFLRRGTSRDRDDAPPVPVRRCRGPLRRPARLPAFGRRHHSPGLRRHLPRPALQALVPRVLPGPPRGPRQLHPYRQRRPASASSPPASSASAPATPACRKRRSTSSRRTSPACASCP